MSRPARRTGSRTAGLVLAAGAGTRFGGPKAPVVIGSQRLVDRAVATLADAGCDPVVVVLGAWTGVVPGARIVVNRDWEQGLASSLRAGLTALADPEPADTGGRPVTAAVVTLVDLPGVTPAAVRRLMEKGGDLATGTYDGRPGHPVLLGREHWAAVAADAEGDRGARGYLAGRPELVAVELADIGDGTDLDRPPTSRVIRAEYPLLHVTGLPEWQAWLAENADTARGVWVVSWRRPTGRPAVAYEDLRDEALCWGWIDSTIRRIDDERTMLRMTPRRRGGVWSRINKDRIAELSATGRIQPRGQAVIEAAQADGSWTALDASDALVEPPELSVALDADPAARAGWEAMPPSHRKQWIFAIMDAKRPATRDRRIADAVAASHARGART